MSGTRLVARLAALATAAALMTITTASTSAATPVPPTCATAGITVTGLGGPNFYIDNGNAPEFRSGYTGYRVTNATGSAVDDLWVSLSGFTGGRLALASGQSAAQRAGSLTSGGTKALFWYLTATGESTSRQDHAVTVYHHDPALANSTALCSTTDGFAAVEGTITAGANKVTDITVSGGAPTLGSTFTVTVTGNTGQIGDGSAADPKSLWMTPAVRDDWPADAFRLVGTSLTISPVDNGAQETYHDILRLAHLGDAARPYVAAYTFQAVGFTHEKTEVKPIQEIASGQQVKHTFPYAGTLPKIEQPVNDLSVALAPGSAQLDSDGGTVTFTADVSGTVGATLDSFVLTPPAGTQPVASSVTWAGAAAQDPVWRDGTLVFPGPFTVPATGARLRFAVAVDGDPGVQAFSLLGVVGPSFIGRTAAPVDGSNPATATVSVDTDPVAGDVSVGVETDASRTVALSGHVSDVDNDPVTVVSVQDAVHGTTSLVAGEILYTPAPGYAGPDTFTYTVSDGRGGTAIGTVTVSVAAAGEVPPDPIAQTITFTQPGDLTTGTHQDLTATASSGLPTTLTGNDTNTCTVSGTTVTAVAAGTCTITATQPGDSTHAAATPVTRDFTITTTPPPPPPPPPPVEPVPPVEPIQPAAQTITFTAPHQVLSGPTPVRLTATSSSGLAVTLALRSGACTLEGDSLVATRDTTCTVEATQRGTDTVAPAQPVQQQLSFVSPQDDAASMESPFVGPDHVDLMPLANDPSGLAFAGVGHPAHGAVTVGSSGALSYAPYAAFHGTDEFTYDVLDGEGRTSTAVVRVSVANAAPRVTGDRVRQLAGTTTSVPISASDPNGDALTLTASTGDAGLTVAVAGTDLSIRAGRKVTGWVTVEVVATDALGATRSTTIHDLVRPAPVDSASRTLTARGTRVSWTPADAGDARYEVLVDGQTACTTRALSCELDRVLGPLFRVQVRVLGRDETTSTRSAARPEGHQQVLIATVYFDSGKWQLSNAQTHELASVAHKITGMGFPLAWVSGYTDSDGGAAYNLNLSRQRTRTVSAYLRARASIASSESWFGYDDPVADNTSAAGRARNRRVEILVRY